MIQLQGVALRQGDFLLRGIDLEVPSGEYAVLMGRTGSGKTTLLEAIAGLVPPTEGMVLLMGRDVTRLPPAARGIGYVPQDAALFPNLTVEEHLEFGPRFQGWSRPDRRRRIGELASELGLAALLTRTPRGLSGGERQRVALGRAIASRPEVLLLDEPLSALDEQTRAEACDLLETVARDLTALHVTHASSEAERLGDRTIQLEDLAAG